MLVVSLFKGGCAFSIEFLYTFSSVLKGIYAFHTPVEFLQVSANGVPFAIPGEQLQKVS